MITYRRYLFVVIVLFLYWFVSAGIFQQTRFLNTPERCEQDINPTLRGVWVQNISNNYRLHVYLCALNTAYHYAVTDNYQGYFWLVVNQTTNYDQIFYLNNSHFRPTDYMLRFFLYEQETHTIVSELWLARPDKAITTTIFK